MRLGDRRNRCFLAALTFSLAVAHSGCTPTTMLAVGEQPEQVLRYVEVGNYVRVLTNGGETYEFEVTELTRFAISGAEQEIPFDDIANVEVRVRDESRVDPVTNVLGIGSMVGILLLLILLTP